MLPSPRSGTDESSCEYEPSCRDLGFCSGHDCFTLFNLAFCNCAPGYLLNYESRCKVIGGKNASIVWADPQRHVLRNHSTGSRRIWSHIPESNEPRLDGIVRHNISSVGMFVFDIADNYVIWHDRGEHRFLIDALDETQRPIEHSEFWTRFPLVFDGHHALIENIISVDGLAIDYVHDLIYWTDSYNKRIEVAQVRDPVKRRVLVDNDLIEPKGIAINVKEGKPSK